VIYAVIGGVIHADISAARSRRVQQRGHHEHRRVGRRAAGNCWADLDIAWRDQRWFGKAFVHILRIKPQDNRFRMTVCTHDYQTLYRSMPDRRYELRAGAGVREPGLISVELTDGALDLGIVRSAAAA
jgi:hypothetical protein